MGVFHVEHLKRCEGLHLFVIKTNLKIPIMQRVEGNIVDIYHRKIFPGVVSIDNGRIISIEQNSQNYEHYLCPGFIDAHVHIESSMLIPQEFSKLAIRRGTVAIVNDPHEIANVMGVEGIQYMLENSKLSDIKTFFTIPSCVPATPYDSAGSVILASDIKKLASTRKFIGLSEMMNVPGVLYNDPEVTAKLDIARSYHLRIDGHAPGLSGDDLKKYISTGISTDHECVDLNEAKEKIAAGMKILIREGSAAKNYEALKSLISTNSDDVMFCTDDSHPNDLMEEGEIDKLVRRAIADGYDLFDVLKIASYNPVYHYGIDVGTLKAGDRADFIKIRNLESFEILSVYIEGIEKYNIQEAEITTDRGEIRFINHFNRKPITLSDIRKAVDKRIIAIKVIPGKIVTERMDFDVLSPVLNFESDVSRDILKIVYVNRYQNTPPQVAFISGFCLKKGAFATSISHDSHNIIAVGCNDSDIVDAINSIISDKGGIVVKNDKGIIRLSLPIAGIMTDQNGEQVARIWTDLIMELKNMGCVFDSPFMTLSFMSLIVIPRLKIGEYGLFDFDSFKFIDE